MIKPLAGHITLNTGPAEDPVPAWRRSLDSASPEDMVKLLVVVSGWTQQHPKSADAWTLLGDAYLKVRQPYAAEMAFRKALGAGPASARAKEGLGLALLSIGRLKDATHEFGGAFQLDPDNAEILVHWGLALLQAGQLKRAHDRFDLATQKNPQSAQAWLNLGIVDIKRGKYDTAERHFLRALELQPDLAQAALNLALTYQQQGRLEPALQAARDLALRHPRNGGHRVLLAELLINADSLQEADAVLHDAVALDPGDPQLYLAWARLYAARREYDQAEGVLNTALALKPDDPEMQLELGHLHLLQQRFSVGWDLHEARKRVDQSPVRRFPLPEWDGVAPVGEHTLVVHAEQGLGDTILFAHCLPDLLQRCRHVVVEVAPRLAPLFARSFPTATVVGRDPSDPLSDWMRALDPVATFQIPIGSLPKLFRRNLAEFQPHAGYLRADPQRVAYWRARLAASGRPTVGLAWRGGLLKTGRESRSIPLEQLALALGGIQAQWISLQYGDVDSEVAQVRAACGFDLHHWAEELKDQDDVAALTCALDAVVTVCTTQAHLTGALGRPGMVLVPGNPNWRYGHRGESMPWYPSLVLNRQSDGSRWAEVMAKIAPWLSSLSIFRTD